MWYMMNHVGYFVTTSESEWICGSCGEWSAYDEDRLQKSLIVPLENR